MTCWEDDQNRSKCFILDVQQTGMCVSGYARLAVPILVGCTLNTPSQETVIVSPPADTSADRSIFFHEDDYCQVQLSTAENLTSLQKEADEILGFSAEHFDGSGFSEIKVREEETHKLAQRRISAEDIETVVLNSGLARFEKVFTGYGSSHREELLNTKAYGKKGCVIFFDVKDDMVEHIWLDYHWGNSEQDKDSFRTCLVEIGQKWNLVLMDWNQLKLVDLSDHSAILAYLNAK
jgi:hypothetical protein